MGKLLCPKCLLVVQFYDHAGRGFVGNLKTEFAQIGDLSRHPFLKGNAFAKGAQSCVVAVFAD